MVKLKPLKSLTILGFCLVMAFAMIAHDVTA